MILLIPHLKGLELRDTKRSKYVAITYIEWLTSPLKTLKRMRAAVKHSYKLGDKIYIINGTDKVIRMDIK